MIKTILSILIALILYDLLKIGYKIITKKFFEKKVEKIFDSKEIDNKADQLVKNLMKDFWEE